MQIDTRRPTRNDTFDLRDQIHSDDHSHVQAHADAANYGTDDEEHSVLEDDSDGEEREEYMEVDDDGSSDLSIPNESIDFDLVYSLHSFAATVEGQANVVKGDSLFLIDDSNSYWWLVRVLKTQEVGYIPAENIETPFERLARLNRHRNVDLASATQAELQDNLLATQDRLRNNLNSRQGSNQTPSPDPRAAARSRQTKGVNFTPALSVHRYPPAVWNEEEEEDEDIEWDLEGYEDEDEGLAQEQMEQEQQRRAQEATLVNMEPDDGMPWEDAAAEDMRARQAAQRAAQPQGGAGGVPTALRPGPGADQQQQQQKQRELLAQQQQQQQQAQPQDLSQIQQQQRQVRSPRDTTADASSVQGRQIDPAEVTETRKVTVTPTIARGSDEGGTLLPSANLQQQQEEERVKRLREEESEESLRKRVKGKEKMAAPVSSASLAKSNGSKLRKERESEDDSKDKKKKGSVFGGLFGRKKDKVKEKNSSISSLDGESGGRTSEDSSRSGRPSTTGVAESAMSPITAVAMQQQQQQQQQQALDLRNSTNPKRPGQDPSQPQQQSQSGSSSPPQVSQHASQLRQKDQQQQLLYQQYLNRSPSSPPEAQPSYGLQSASAVMPGPSSYHSPPPSSGGSGAGLGPPSARPRPGSLILTPSSMDGQGVGVPDLSVIRVFAGKNLETEATFKTVLLNSSTTSAELVKQAIQRFRLPAGEDEHDYYLTVKQVEGSSAVLHDSEKPLGVFDSLVEAAMELPKVKRSSVGSISSVASNLSMHPAIRKLSMNDFTDDSAVKFYLNRRTEEGAGSDSIGHGAADETLVAADTSMTGSEGHSGRGQFLTVSTTQGSNVPPERFSSPSFRFALQLVIYTDDLPDDMVFDPMTEAIIFKNTLRDRSASSQVTSPGIPQNFRRKVFVFPKNVTVAEVIELGLERFGISDGVVDGGDEIEDKLNKRRSAARVRYGLAVNNRGQERELAPASKVIDAFPRPPTFRAVDRRSQDHKRRSIDSAQLLGTQEDVNPDDPIFILRRAISYRNSTSRHRTSAPLDEIALANLHRDSASSIGSDPFSNEDSKQKQPSRQEIIAAQRAARRDNQRAILSAQTNSVRGVDVLLPGNAILRSSRYDSNDRMRYSYVEPDGEAYDISDIVEEEWRESNLANKNDLLEGVLGRNKDGLGEKLDRVLNKIKTGRRGQDQSATGNKSISRSPSPSSQYSLDENTVESPTRSRSVTPGSASLSRTPIPAGAPRGASPSSTLGRSSPLVADDRVNSRAGTATPPSKPPNRRQPSIASVMSDLSGYATAATQPAMSRTNTTSPYPGNATKVQTRRPLIPPDDFGVSHMLAIIEHKGSKPRKPLPPLDPVDELLFGRSLDLNTLHPKVREIYSDSFKQLDDMDKVLDTYLQRAIGAS